MISKSDALAALLLKARRAGQPIDGLPPELIPATVEEAYAVQEAVAPQLGAIVGWKVGASGPTAEPACAPLFADLVAASPAHWAASRFSTPGIEGELAFRLGKSLPRRSAPYDEDEVWEAVDTLHVAIEICDSRFAEPQTMNKLALLADNQNNGAFCYGAAMGAWRGIDFLRQPASLLLNDNEVANAVGGNAAGHPRRLLAWLANHRARRGHGLVVGDIVTTGSHTGLVFAAPGTQVTARFADIGDARLTLTA